MKRTMKSILSRRRRWTLAPMLAAAAGLAVAVPMQAQTQDGTQDRNRDRNQDQRETRQSDRQERRTITAEGLDIEYRDINQRDDWSNDEYEFERGEGLHEEEWYDPTDWFNDDETRGVTYERDDWGYDYDYYDDDRYLGNRESYEWSPGEGYHEEEWYDPSDWFNDDGQVSYDYDDWGYDYYDDNYRAGYDYWDSPYDNDYPATTYRDWDYYTDEDDPLDYDYWDSRYDYDYRAQRDRMSDRNYGDRPTTHMTNSTLSGRLDGWQKRNLQGQRDSHTLVKMRLENGRSAIVNLGPNVELSRLNLDRGDRILVKGDRGRIDGKQVLMAQRVRIDDRTIRMNNWDPKASDQRRSADAQRNRSATRDQYYNQNRSDWYTQDRDRARTQASSAQLRGQLDGWQKVSLNGERDDHTLVRLRLEDGTSKIVNLGPNVEVSRLDLDRGDRIAVQGVRGSIDGKSVICAKRVKVGDKVVRMNNWDARKSGDNWSPDKDERGSDARDRTMDRNQSRTAAMDRNRESSDREADRRAMQRDTVDRIVSEWPAESRKAAERMIKAYGEPDAASKLRLTWLNKGPFVKTIVHKQPVEHNFPAPHKDVLEQFVNYKVPADKMDELAKFDGSIIVFRTDGLMSARCHKEDMNILALNLADQVIQGERTWQEARDKFTQVATAYQDGDRPEITQRLAFDSKSSNSSEANHADGDRRAQR